MRLDNIQEANISTKRTVEWKYIAKKGSFSEEREKHGGVCPTCHRDGWRQFPETTTGVFPVIRYLWGRGFSYYTLKNPKPIIIKVGGLVTQSGRRVYPIEKIISGGDQIVWHWNPKPHNYENWQWQAPNFQKGMGGDMLIQELQQMHNAYVMVKDTVNR